MRTALLEIALCVRGGYVVPCVGSTLTKRNDVVHGCSKQVRETAVWLNLRLADMARPAEQIEQH